MMPLNPDINNTSSDKSDTQHKKCEKSAEKMADSQNCDGSIPKSHLDKCQTRYSTNLEEIDKKLEELHEMAENVLLSTASRRRSFDETVILNLIPENSQAKLKKCETVPAELTKQASEEEAVFEEVEEALRDAEEKQFIQNHKYHDIECSSDDESVRRYKSFCQSDQDMRMVSESQLFARTPSNSGIRRHISSNVTLNDYLIDSIGHERARSNDSRSTSLFSSSIASFRRPISHFSIDNSCFELSDAQIQHSLMCTPIEKVYVKNSRSAPEMQMNDAKLYSFISSPSPSNEETTTSEPSVSSQLSVDQPICSSNINCEKKICDSAPSEETKKSLQMEPTQPIKTTINERAEKSKKSFKNVLHPVDPNQKRHSFENRSVEIINIKILSLHLHRKLKKSLYVMAKLDTNDVYQSQKLKVLREMSNIHEFTIETMESYSKLHIIFLEGSKARVARPVGKVTLDKKTIETSGSNESTLQLKAVSKYPEFCGQICVDIRRKKGSFSVRIVDCGGLNLKVNKELLLLVSNIDAPSNVGKLTFDSEEKRSKEWLEMPCSEGLLKLKLTLWQDLLKGSNAIFHGQVRLDVDENWEAGPAKWFYLRSKSKDNGCKTTDEIGEVVIRTTHQTDHILHLHVYKPLLNIINLSGNVEPITASILAVIESLPKVELSQVSRSIVELLFQTDNIRSVLNSLYLNNIVKCQDENTLFRGQSLAGKMLFEILTSFGKLYLTTTIKPVIDKIYKERKNCEIDPSRVIPGCSLEKNKTYLLTYFQSLFDRVTQSSANCPHFVKQLLHDLRVVVESKTGREEVQRLAVSSFVIMRFFAAAVLNPKAFEIRRDQPDTRVSRTLLLLSKMLQRVSNCTVSQGPLSSKEVWLSDVFETVTSEHYKKEMSDFLDKISLVGDSDETEKNTVFKFGNLQQVEKSRLAWKKIMQYKKRYVQLTDSHLKWHKDVKLAPKGIVNLQDVRNINLENKNIITISTDNTQVQFEAPGGVEANDWVMAIEKQRVRCGMLCNDVTYDPLTFDMERHLDKIHNVLHKYRDTMLNWMKELKGKKDNEEVSNLEIINASYLPENERQEHKKILYHTLESIIDVTDGIQKAHEEYKAKYTNKNKMEETTTEDI